VEVEEETMTIKLTALLAIFAGMMTAQIKTVHFLSEDQKTKLVGYVFEPSGPGPHAAVVMLHGRAGPYSSLAKGVYTSATLSKRHKEWGEFWAQRGYVAMLVDSFGPRGHPSGFGLGSYENRPPEVSEQTVRPLDAYGALQYLRRRRDINPQKIGVQGWSNGGMTVLVTIGEHSPGIENPTTTTGFRAAIAEYPGCGMDALKGSYRAYSPTLLMIAAADEEVSPKRCQDFAKKAQAAGSRLEVKVYEGAEHNFDDPGKKKQSNPANREATADAMRSAERFFAAQILR
jgi:dienelactone hydrolase